MNWQRNVLGGLVLLVATAVAWGYMAARGPVDVRTDRLAAEERQAPPLRSANIQIKAGQLFTVPLTDGSTGIARCENVDGKARMTIIVGGQFLDLQLLAWGTEPTPQPTPTPTPTPPTPPVVPPTPTPTPTPVPVPTPPATTAAALIVVTDTPGSGSWSTSAVAKALSARGITPYNYAIESVGDPAFNDPVALSWIGKSAGKPTPFAFLADAAGKILWSGPAATSDAAWLALLDQHCKPVAFPAKCNGTCPATKGRR